MSGNRINGPQGDKVSNYEVRTMRKGGKTPYTGPIAIFWI